MSDTDAAPRALPRGVPPVLLLIAPVILAAALALAGSGDAVAAWATLLQRLIISGGLAALWLVGAIGLGSLARPLWSHLTDDVERAALQSAVGVAMALWLAAAIGRITLHPVAAWLPVGVGTILLVRQLAPRLSRIKARPLPLHALLLVPGAAVMLIAACLPPGSIWHSEAHGYDALSYHLQLPKEWLAGGRIAPLEHNVYSFLPSGMEAVYAQLGAMAWITDGRLGTGDGSVIYAAQLLHAGLAFVAAFATGAVVKRFTGAVAAWIAAATIVSIPWVVVTASLAYNEMAVLVGLAGALLAIVTAGPARSVGILVGLLIGAAALAKPTAMLTAMPVAAVAMLGLLPRRSRSAAFALAAITGLAVLAPWLIRNAAAGGNPVFPWMTSFFGNAHWTPEQVRRWADGHSLDVGIGARLARLFSVAHGFAHPQWFYALPLFLAAAAVASQRPETRRLSVVLLIGIGTQFLAWLAVGHLQSRFLIPVVIPGAILIGLACKPGVRCYAVAVFTLLVAVIGFKSIEQFLRERDGRPCTALIPGVEGMNGRWHAHAWAESGGMGLSGLIGSDAEINLRFHDQPVRISLLGDATPLYLKPDIVYHTTWDRSPLGDILRAFPDDPERWQPELAALGITHILINRAELARLRASGWLDPEVTEDAVTRLEAALGPPVARWPQRGQTLYPLGIPTPSSR